MKILSFCAAALAAILLTTSGCRTRGALPPLDATGDDAENRLNAVLLSPGAQHSVTYSGLQHERLPDGRLRVRANVLNRENRRIQVQVNCVFKDGQGFAVEEMPFETLILTENAQETVAFTSLSDKAERYTIRIREAR